MHAELFHRLAAAYRAAEDAHDDQAIGRHADEARVQFDRLMATPAPDLEAAAHQIAGQALFLQGAVIRDDASESIYRASGIDPLGEVHR